MILSLRAVARLAAVAAAVGVVHTACADRTPKVEVTTALITRGPIVHRVVAAGTLQPVRTVEVGTQVSGMIEWLGADFNSIVRKEQVIARIEPSLIRAQLDSARASLERARAALSKARSDLEGLRVLFQNARRQYERATRLFDKHLVPRSDRDAAQTAVDSFRASAASQAAAVKQAEAAVAQADAAVQQRQVDLAHTIIRSPLDGVVLSREVEVGQRVAASFETPTLFTIAAGFDRMELNLSIDEADIGQISRGQPLTFQVAAHPAETFAGVVSQVRLEPVLVASATTTTRNTNPPATVTYNAIIDVPQAQGRLVPGMTAIATFVIPRCEDCVRIPNDALAFRPSVTVLETLDQDQIPVNALPTSTPDDATATLWHYEDGELKPEAVVTGVQGDLYTELVEGPLEPGETVVTSAILPRVSTPIMTSPLAPSRRAGRFRGFRGF